MTRNPDLSGQMDFLRICLPAVGSWPPPHSLHSPWPTCSFLCLKSPSNIDIEDVDVVGAMFAQESAGERAPPLFKLGVSQVLSVPLEISLAAPKDPDRVCTR